MFLFSKKIFKYIIYILILLVILVYVINISYIPDSIVLFENDSMNLNPILGVKLEESIEVASNLDKEITNNSQTKQYKLSLLGLNLKTITTHLFSTVKVIPLGNLVGLKLYTKGVLVVGTSEIKGVDNKVYKPYEDAGIQQGDTIIEINGEEIETTDELMLCVSKCNGDKIDIKYVNDGNVLNTSIKPVKTKENTYKIGLWVRDATAGVGTATFYDVNTKSIASLGHSIQDIDTGKIVEIDYGEFVTADIVDIEKGKKDDPGKIEGSIENNIKIGDIYNNTEFGIYGEVTDVSKLQIDDFETVEVASRNEVKTGKASIICTLENDIRKEYEVEIQKIYISNNENNKSMLVKVTDEELIEKTGGIIQGMSGSPVLQNGKLIGALTHVLVSSPDKGYAVFADMMIKEMRAIE